jgi:capsule polysaccharide modification protein KpsS
MTTWKKDEIKEKLMMGDVRWIERAVIAIFNKQTENEKEVESTNMRNNVGFTGADAKILTSFAKQLLKNKNRHLSDKQMAIAKKRIVKYAGQLAKIANGKI